MPPIRARRPSSWRYPATQSAARLCDFHPYIGVEQRARSNGADDTQTEIQRKTAEGAIGEPAGEAASGNADQNEDDN